MIEPICAVISRKGLVWAEGRSKLIIEIPTALITMNYHRPRLLNPDIPGTAQLDRLT
jgi:hypothetical protein